MNHSDEVKAHIEKADKILCDLSAKNFGYPGWQMLEWYPYNCKKGYVGLIDLCIDATEELLADNIEEDAYLTGKLGGTSRELGKSMFFWEREDAPK